MKARGLARLRNRRFFSLGDLNAAIAVVAGDLNKRAACGSAMTASVTVGGALRYADGP
ncbi:hypothetical protein X750_28230 [Mesorhizobium sp. LNJC394B00]|nr:hypothetical protein X750_28230 [Mesorhizobium sp. LNJC394B00]